MNRSIFAAIPLLLFATASFAQVTCTRNGDQTYCNGSLQQSRPAPPRVYYDPAGSYNSGYEQGVREGRARNVASATQLYMRGEISRQDRQRFLEYIAKYGGDVNWFRNDMVITDQQQGVADIYTPGWAGNAPTQTEHAAEQTVAERLAQLEKLRSSSAISQNEYDAKRKQIIDSL